MEHSRQPKKNMKRRLMIKMQVLSLFMLVFALTLCVSTGWAGEKGHKYGHNPAAKLEKLTEKLSLTKEQQEKILPILQEKHTKMEALHNQMKEARQHAVGQIEALLTPEQLETFRKAREERRKKMEEYRGKHDKGHKKGKHNKDDDD